MQIKHLTWSTRRARESESLCAGKLLWYLLRGFGGHDVVEEADGIAQVVQQARHPPGHALHHRALPGVHVPPRCHGSVLRSTLPLIPDILHDMWSIYCPLYFLQRCAYTESLARPAKKAGTPLKGQHLEPSSGHTCTPQTSCTTAMTEAISELLVKANMQLF